MIQALTDWIKSLSSTISITKVKNLQDKWISDTKIIDKLPGKKTMAERIVREIMQAKKAFGILISWKINKIWY